MFSLTLVSVSVVAKKMMSDFMDLLSCKVPDFPVTSEMETLSCLVHNAQHECCFPYWTFLASLLPDRGNLKPSEVTKHLHPPSGVTRLSSHRATTSVSSPSPLCGSCFLLREGCAGEMKKQSSSPMPNVTQNDETGTLQKSRIPHLILISTNFLTSCIPLWDSQFSGAEEGQSYCFHISWIL